MPTDVYIKFGTTDKVIGPLNTPASKIEGDSTDAWHYWWCELRGCGFDLAAKDPKPDPAKTGTSKGKDKDKDESKSKFEKVTLTKRVDWASTQLFIKCCEQALALSETKDEQAKVWIDIVTVEVCRPAGGVKLPYVIVEYHGVRITHYAINISAAEPSESITFEFQKLVFKHTRTDPYSGNQASEYAKTTTGELTNSGTGQSGTAQGSGTEPGGGGASSGSARAAPTGGSGTGGSDAGPTPAGPSTASNDPIGTGFSGYGQGPNFET